MTKEAIIKNSTVNMHIFYNKLSWKALRDIDKYTKISNWVFNKHNVSNTDDN